MQVFLSGTLTFGVPLLFAVRELAALRRRPPRSRGPDDPGPRPPPPKPRDLSPTQRPLPACLIPVRTDLVAKPERVLEHV